MSKFCRKCGAQLSPGVEFCGSCGTIIQSPQIPLIATTTQKTSKPIKLIILGIAVLMVLIVLAITVPRLMDAFKEQNSLGIDSVDGQPYSGRAITICGEGFGYYDIQNSRVTVDGRDASIVTWGETEVTIIVPEDITAGKKEILLMNPPVFKEKSAKKEFFEHTKIELTRATLSPSKASFIEGDGFELIVPEGSVAEEQEIIIYKYDAPALEDSPYYTVIDEYEITDPDGSHIFFDHNVYFSLEVADEEEALKSSIQIFDEYMGIWVKAETLYNRGDGKLYLVTSHFSGFRRFANEMYKGAGRMVDQAVVAGKKNIEYIYQKGKGAKDAVVKLTEEAYIMVKDVTVEEFVGVTDANQKFIIYYRSTDATNDASIPETARLMAAAFSTAYDEYKSLFGEDKVPAVTRKVIVPTDADAPPTVFGVPDFNSYKVELIPDPIKIYIDPRYNQSGAKASIVTGNIIMPSDYQGESLASTCAHELFHAVQYHLLGVKQIYMANGLKDIDGSFTGGDAEVYRMFSDNKWFLEATAEYAGRFIGTSVGVGAPMHQSIDASRAYYALNGSHDYGVSSFLDYIITSRQTDEGGRLEGFRELWNTVTGNYGVLTDINTALDAYVNGKLGSSTQSLYENFWRDAFTRSFMPKTESIAGGLVDINTLNKAKINTSMAIKENGVGIIRYNLSPAYMRKDETALTRSFWLEASPVNMIGDVYRLDSLEMTDRVPGDPPYEGAVNNSDKAISDVLVPYSSGDSFGLIAIFMSRPAKDNDIQVTISSTSLKWDNQKDIEKKVGNATLSSDDKLKFTPVLPGQKPGDPPFAAVVTLNNSEDYKTEIDKVENGKSFEVNAPMKELPPDKISVNIKIFKDGKLVHEYQSGELKAEVSVYISGPRDMLFELTKEELPYIHDFTAKAWPVGEYQFKWSFGNGFEQATTGKEESNVSADYMEFGKYKPTVTLYDMKGNILATHDVTLTLKQKDESPSTSNEPPTSSESADTSQTTPEKKYAWVLVETKTNEKEWQEKLTTGNKDSNWFYEISASEASATFTITYIGKNSDSWMTTGISQSGQVTWTEPSHNTIMPDEEFSLKLNVEHLYNDHVNQAGGWMGLAQVFLLDENDEQKGGAAYLTDREGESSFVSSSANNYKSYSTTVYGKIGAGSTEGERMAVRVSASPGANPVLTYYIYEWKQVN